MNSKLPPDIAVTGVRRVPPDFNPRRTKGKLYEYVIRNAPIPDPIASRFEWHNFKPLSVEAMRQGAAHLLGTHDFTSFQAADCERQHKVRTITRVDIVEDGPVIRIQVGGTAFLKNMVRIVAGTLFSVGRGFFTPEQVKDIIAAQDRRIAGPTLPARGLTLIRVVYHDEDPSILYPGAKVHE